MLNHFILSAATALAPPPSHMKAQEGMKTGILATEPMIQDPVAFWIDPDGRLYVAETERSNHGTMDNRSSSFWLDDDLQAMTVEDRLAYYEKWEGKRKGGMAYYNEKPDRVRSSIDRDGDGVYDEFTVFAGPFNDTLDGIGSGVMRVGDEIWYANIPNLWRLVDADGDGVAEIREPIHTGFGVRTALYGHDMHGFVRGPDGRVYWSIGDRGYHVRTPDGRLLADPRAGAVFRCEPDGSNLEVFHTGLRNPQELAFNSVGDLFTGDNTSDAGDQARIVFVAEDGETGWCMDYQTLEGSNQRGPWNQEATWQVLTDENVDLRPAWPLPPLAHVGSGPSGLAYYPGLGLSEKYDDHLFMCDFRGSRPTSVIWSFQAVPEGAGYRIEQVDKFLENVLATDVMFDWNGRVLVSEWGKGWSASESGYLHAAWDPETNVDPRIAEARDLAINGMNELGTFELSDLLSHPDQRIRLMAQFEIAERGKIDPFLDVVRYEDDRMARLHSIWGIGQIARGLRDKGKRINRVMSPLVELLDDPDPEVRAQAAKTLGDPLFPESSDALIDQLSDDSDRVRYQAVITLGKMKEKDAIPFLLGVLVENEDRDPFLRHAVATALWRIDDEEALAEIAAHPLPSVRKAAVLALRRGLDPSLERLVFDDDPSVALEAVRAAHDKPIPEVMPAVAALAEQYRPGIVINDDVRHVPLLRRIISANQRLGEAGNVEAIAMIASNESVPMSMRKEAMAALASFENPGNRDRVLGWWRPVENAPRDRADISEVLARTLPSLAADSAKDIRRMAIKLGIRYDVGVDPSVLFDIAVDETKPVSDRVTCIEQLPGDDGDRLRKTLAQSIQSSEPEVRIASRNRLASFAASEAEPALVQAFTDGTQAERQAAIRTLSQIDSSSVHTMMNGLIVDGGLDDVSPELRLDVLEAFSASGHEPLERFADQWWSDNGTKSWEVALSGGDAEEGMRVVRYHSGATCLRCHVIGGRGGEAGPSLEGVGQRLDRAAILQSIIAPQAVITDGYGEASAMPNMQDLLTAREIRDVVAYLETLEEDDAAAEELSH